jgi:hypothetical protein
MEFRQYENPFKYDLFAVSPMEDPFPFWVSQLALPEVFETLARVARPQSPREWGVWGLKANDLDPIDPENWRLIFEVRF